VVYAPFSRAVALLHCPARLALAHLPPGSAAGQAWSPALYCVSPLACPALRRNCLQESRARGSATSGVFASLRSALLSAVLPFGQKPAHLVSVALSLILQKPARLVVMRRFLHSVVPFQQIIAFCHFVPKGSCLLTKTSS